MKISKSIIRKIEPTEHQIQYAIVEWVNVSRIGDFLIAIPNGGNRSITEGVRLKKEGVKRGVSDLFFAIPCFDYHGLWIEVKTKKGKLSNHQERWLNNMNKLGYRAIVVRSVDEGIQAIKDYLGIS